MTLNTYVAGNPGEARSFARELRKLGQGTETSATGVHQARKQAAGEWDGAASEAFQGWAKTQGTDGDALAEVYPTVARAHEAWADEIDTVQARMEQAKQVARDGGLTVMGNNLILPPKAPQMRPPEPPKGRATAAQSEQYSQDKAAYDAAMAEMHRQQAVWEEAKATVEGARQKERAAHETFVNAMDQAKAQLKDIGQAQKWAQAGVHPASSAAGGLAQAATAMEARSADAAQALLEGAIGKGPAAVNAAWASMPSAQQADLIRSHPGLVGATDGVPATARDEANRIIFAGARQRMTERLRTVEHLQRFTNAKDPMAADLAERQQNLSESLDALDDLQAELDKPDRYLLGFDEEAFANRGEVIVAHGNPDTADNTMTLVPGTFSDAANATDYVTNNDKVLQVANEQSPNANNAVITWSGYDSPDSLMPGAARPGFADEARGDLSQFQEGLRATHQGDTPSRNTLVGHSYGSTVVGDTSHNDGSHADNIVLLGSPGIPDVEHAKQLDVPADHMWGGTSESDSIHLALDPLEQPFTSTDEHWFGRSPADPEFGGRTLPVDPNTAHEQYWDKQESRDAMGRIMTGKDPQ